MRNTIKYVLCLMTICITGLILTQFFWLYKDYKYYHSQPLLSTDFNFYVPRMQVANLTSVRPSASWGKTSPISPLIPASPVYTLADGLTAQSNDVEGITPMMKTLPAPGMVTRGVPATFIEKIPEMMDFQKTIAVQDSSIKVVTAPGNQGNTTENSTSSAMMTPSIAATNAPTGIPIPTLAVASVLANEPGVMNSIVAYPTTQAIPAGRITNRIYPKMGDVQIFQAIPYSAPVSYILNKMKWQFGSSLLLIITTAGCLVYMLTIIFRQRKVSVMKSDFISNMTHELKTPLATVSVAIEAMRNYGALEDKDKTQLYLNISKNEIEHLSILIEMILQQSIFDADKMDLDKRDTDINKLLEQLISTYSLSLEKIDLTLVSDPYTPLLYIDPLHISNVVSNLINNAVKYSLENKVIRIASSYEKECWKLVVSDNGIGIPKIYLKNVFERFFRVPGKQTKTIKGFGLGLFYVKQVVELHKGEIALESSQSGSTFTISIPFK